MIYPSQIVAIKPDLEKFRDLNRRYGVQATKEDFEDILKFLLLFHTGVGHMCESADVDFLYEELGMSLLTENFNENLFNQDIAFESELEGISIEEILNEDWDSAAEPAKDYKAAVGLGVLAAAGAVALPIYGAIKAVQYTKYLMKKGKIKSAVQKEGDTALKTLELYQKQFELKKRIADLKGEGFSGLGKLPEYPEPPAMEEEKSKSIGDIAKGVLGDRKGE
jgi:hypothetical protein